MLFYAKIEDKGLDSVSYLIESQTHCWLPLIFSSGLSAVGEKFHKNTMKAIHRVDETSVDKNPSGREDAQGHSRAKVLDGRNPIHENLYACSSLVLMAHLRGGAQRNPIKAEMGSVPISGERCENAILKLLDRIAPYLQIGRGLLPLHNFPAFR